MSWTLAPTGAHVGMLYQFSIFKICLSNVVYEQVSNCATCAAKLFQFWKASTLLTLFVAHTGAACFPLLRHRSRLLFKWGQMESLMGWGTAEDHMPEPREDEGRRLNGRAPHAAVPGLKGNGR